MKWFVFQTLYIKLYKYKIIVPGASSIVNLRSICYNLRHDFLSSFHWHKQICPNNRSLKGVETRRLIFSKHYEIQFFQKSFHRIKMNQYPYPVTQLEGIAGAKLPPPLPVKNHYLKRYDQNYTNIKYKYRSTWILLSSRINQCSPNNPHPLFVNSQTVPVKKS